MRLDGLSALVTGGTGRMTGYEDIFTKIEMCRRHYRAVGLGDHVDQFIR